MGGFGGAASNPRDPDLPRFFDLTVPGAREH